jgi:acetyl esterase/lipase
MIGRAVVAAGVLLGSALGSALGPVAPPPTVSAASRFLDPMFAVDVQRDVVYGTATRADGTPITLTLDLYTPRGDVAAGRPVFVFAHGGFFVAGDKADTTAWPTRMAQRGYVAASINYRLGAVPVIAPVDTAEEVRIVDDARADMQTSVRWFRENAGSLRIDPDRIAVGGTSAGAVTALGVAIGGDDPLPGDHADQSSGVCTAVSISGANAPTAVGPNDTGALFVHGTADTVVPYDLAVQTRDAMVANGLPVSWNPISGKGHGLTSTDLAPSVAVTIQWLHDRVATAPYPCSPAVAAQPRVPAGRTTTIDGPPGRSGVVSLVATENRAAGYIQALRCGGATGASSNLNSDAPGQTRAALAVVEFDAQGRACLFNQASTHLVADLQGTFTPGAFEDVVDDRLLDTRRGPMPAGGSMVEVRGRPDSTAVVSLTLTETTAAGYLQVLPCGTSPGAWSNLNADAAGQTRAGLAFVRFAADGRVCVFVQRSGHVVVDLQGYMSPDSFDDTPDDRVLDSRSGPMPAAGSVTVVRGRPSTTGVVSFIATETTGAGFVQVLDCGTAPGSSSNLNVDAPGQTLAGLAFVRFAADGTACVFTQRPTHLVADVQGYLTAGAFDDVTPDQRLLDTRRR